MNITNKLNKLKKVKKNMPTPPQEASQNLQQVAIPYQRTTDGRYFRRTGRTIQFTTRVTPDYDSIIRQIAHQEGILLVEVLEKSLVAYCEQIKWQGDISNIRDKHSSSRIHTHTERERER